MPIILRKAQTQPNISSAANLGASAQQVRDLGERSVDDLSNLVPLATAIAEGLEQTQLAIQAIENRLRSIGDPIPGPDYGRIGAIRVSSDRLSGGIQVQDGLKSVRGQGMDLTFEDQVAHVASKDHGSISGWLELDVDGYSVVITSHGGTTTITGTVTITGAVTASGKIALDTGASPAASQITLKANALGALSFLSYAADNQQLYFDAEWSGSALVARDTSSARFIKTGDQFKVSYANGLTPGNTFTYTGDSIGIDLLTGLVSIFGIPVYANNAAAITGGLAVGALYRTGANPDPVCVVH